MCLLAFQHNVAEHPYRQGRKSTTILGRAECLIHRRWEYKTHPSDKELLILCISHERVEKDRAIRAKQEERFLKDLLKVQARIQNGRLKNDVKIGEAMGRLKERYILGWRVITH